MSDPTFWLVVEVHSAQFDSMQGPIVVDAFPDEQQARDEAERLARVNPGTDYGLFVMIESVQATMPEDVPVSWTECGE